MPVSNQIELRHLHYFLAVAEELHFRKAADKLFISQPGLSRQIKQLEELLGITLFERHNRDVKLTKAGAYLHAEISRNLSRLDGIFEHAKLLQDGKQGRLNFGYVGSAMQELIPKLLLAFEEEHPNVIFSLKEMDNQSQIDSLIAHDIDIGFVRLERVPRGLYFKQILKEPFCLVLPKDHPLDSSNFKSLTQLKNESFILFDPKYSTSYYEKVMQIFDDSGFSPIVSHNTIHADSIYSLIKNKFGVSIVPKSLQVGHDPGVKFIELSKIPQRTVLSMVWDPSNMNPSLEHFIKLIK
ncbi:LysR family transcriptional regulator [Mangrovimonas sp. TPBH4]|uniref:LysR family transcriptional regulator n=1 Tax=Mangrovimonas sp. TPBH4 TaxID=1645914 RepID=UPI0006B4905C|nr:LysR family transcriptional regulator [Mangrovimonas sp. TPBH4]